MGDQIINQIVDKRKPYPFRNGSQCDRIVQYLLSGKRLLNWEIREKFQCLSHTARLNEIRKAGFNVQSEMLENGIWQYWLPEESATITWIRNT